MTPIRKTERGWEVTAAMVTIIGAAITLAGFFVTITAAAVGARQQLANSTPLARHDSLVHAVIDVKAAVDDVRATEDTLRRNLLGLTCNQAHYPSPFCDAVPRVLQAGSPRP